MLLRMGVSLVGLHPIMRVPMKEVERAFQFYADAEAVITSAVDREHGIGSWHYVGLALDFRINHVTDEQWDAIIRDLRSTLSALGFEVFVHEGSHVHIEPSDSLAKRLGLMP